MTRSMFARAVALTMATVLLLTSLPVGVAQAALVSTDQVLGDSAQDGRRKVEAFLQRQDTPYRRAYEACLPDLPQGPREPQVLVPIEL